MDMNPFMLDNYNFTISSRNSGFSSTHNIKQLGFSGLRGFILASTFFSVDKDAARKPNRFIL
jgi:hypothetical protein